MDELEKEFIGFFSDVFKSYGLGDLASKIIGVLYLEPKEVSMEDIAKKTGYSLPSISNTIKMLENTGIVRRIKKPGTKKVFLYMEKNLIKLNVQKINAAHSNLIKPAKDILPRMIEKYKDRVKDDKSRRKLRIIENYYAQLLQFERILDNMKEKLEEMSSKMP